MKRGFSFSVTVVVSAIVFIYFCTVFVFIDRWFGLMTSPGIMNAIAFTGVAFMCVLNYAYAILADPGRVPSSFMPDIEDPEVPIHEIKRKLIITESVILALRHLCNVDAPAIIDSSLTTGGDLRFCQKCSCFKPPRAHHCRVCKRCILRMDHHCNWINNCVGHANYKVFFVFVVYAVIACIYSLILLVGSLTNNSQNDKQHSADTFRIAYVISGLLLVPLSVALSVLLGWHIYLILQNKTTIEYHEGVRAMWLAEKGGTVYKHPYDIGAYENLTTVLGPSIFCWICPFSRHIGNGLRFRTAYDRVSTSSTSK
ncbi:hypothetical protein GOBAR_DD02906 [Gossypium barbadense]|nr:hypothetical protein GOBAR_DD02906 [Gossypium barbadense]